MKVPVFAMAAAFLAAPAAAQPPHPGWIGPLATPSIVCDTSAQLESIVDAFEDGVEAGKSRFLQLFGTKNHRSEPTCAIVAVRAARAGAATDLGRVRFADAEVYGWILHIKNDISDGYYLYLESPSEALKNTI